MSSLSSSSKMRKNRVKKSIRYWAKQTKSIKTLLIQVESNQIFNNQASHKSKFKLKKLFGINLIVYRQLLNTTKVQRNKPKIKFNYFWCCNQVRTLTGMRICLLNKLRLSTLVKRLRKRVLKLFNRRRSQNSMLRDIRRPLRK